MQEFFNSIPLGFYVFGTSLNFSISFFMGTLLLIKNPHSKPNKIFIVYSYFIATWSLFYTLSLITNDKNLSLFFLRTCMFPVAFVATIFFHFIITLIKINKYKLFIKINYIFSFISACLVFTDYFAYGYISYPVIKHWLIGGPVLIISIIHFFFMLLFAYYLLIKEISKVPNILKIQYIYILIGTSIGYIAGLSNYLVWFQSNFPPILNVVMVLFVFTTPYVILRYKLLDINYAFKKILSYSVYLIGISVLMFLLISYFLNIKSFQLLLIVFFITALIPFVYKLIIYIMDSIVLKDFKIILKNLDDFFLDKNYNYPFNNLNNWSFNFIKKLHSITNVKQTIFFIFNKEKSEYLVSASEGVENIEGLSIKQDSPIIKYLINARRHILKSELLESEQERSILNIMNELGAEIIFPFFTDDELLGILCIGNRKGTILFHDNEIQKLVYLMNNVETNFKNVFFNQILDDIKNISKRFNEFKGMAEFVKYLLSSILRLFNIQYASIYLHNPEKKLFYQAFQLGSKDNENSLSYISDDHYFFRVLKDTEKIIVCNEFKSEMNLTLTDLKETANLMDTMEAEVIMPLISSKLLGFISLGRKREKFNYSNNDLLILNQLAVIIAIKIHSILIKEESELDPLTQAKNRAFLSIGMYQTILTAKKENKPVSVLFIDFDHFKEINDKKGHEGGDMILREFGKCVNDISRANDILFRTGGEEFVWVLYDVNSEKADTIKDRLLVAMKNRNYINKLTLSIGKVCFIPDKKENLITNNIKSIEKRIFKLGDDATYRAKLEGRNRLCDGGIILDSEINEKYQVSLQIIANEDVEKIDEIEGYFNNNNIKSIKSNWDDCLQIFESEKSNYFLFVIDKNINLDKAKKKILEIKKRSLSSLVGVIFEEFKHKEDFRNLSVNRFFLQDQINQIEDWAKILAKEE